MNNPKWSQSSRWRHVRDDDAHDYIIPADKTEEFYRWVDANDGFNEEKAAAYHGEEFDHFRCRMHPSCYVFVGTVEEDK